MANAAKTGCIGLALCFLLSRGVGAEETAGSPPQGDSTSVSPESARKPIPGIKSGTTALLWSLLGTAVPVVTGTLGLYRNDETSTMTGAVLAGGLIIGPSLGHFYSARPGRALLGIGIRTLASAAVAAAFVEAVGEGNSNNLVALGTVGLIIGAGSLVWDIASAPHSAQAHNDLARQSRLSIGVIPSIGPVGVELRAAMSF